jgi:hypothetical protein
MLTPEQLVILAADIAADPALRPGSNVGQPPLHQGCDSVVVPI